MRSALSRVTSKGQVVIPKGIREKYGIDRATAIRWIEKEEGILMVPESEDPIKAARGMFSGSGILKAYLRGKGVKRKEKTERLVMSKRFVLDSYALIVAYLTVCEILADASVAVFAGVDLQR